MTFSEMINKMPEKSARYFIAFLVGMVSTSDHFKYKDADTILSELIDDCFGGENVDIDWLMQKECEE